MTANSATTESEMKAGTSGLGGQQQGSLTTSGSKTESEESGANFDDNVTDTETEPDRRTTEMDEQLFQFITHFSRLRLQDEAGEELKKLLANGANPNAWYWYHQGMGYGTSVLNLAICSTDYDLEIVRLLIAAGAKAYAHDLYSPCCSGHVEICKELLSAGVDPNSVVVQEHNTTPLMKAATYGQEDVVRLLIEAGADKTINATDAEGSTALFFAAANNYPEVVSLLLAAGALVNHRCFSGMTALMYGATVTQVRFDVLMLEDYCMDRRGAFQDPFDVSDDDSSEVVSLLLNAGAAVNERSSDGFTAAMGAAACGKAKSLALLIAAGADIKMVDDLGRSLLHYAACRNKPEIISQLVTAGADVNHGDDSGDRPIMVASRRGYDDLVASLISAGADISACDEKGRTATMYAAMYVPPPGPCIVSRASNELPAAPSRSTVLTQLISAGADLNARAECEALHWRFQNSTTIAQPRSTALIMAVSIKNLQNANELVIAGADVDTYDCVGHTALHYACYPGRRVILGQPSPPSSTAVLLLADSTVNAALVSLMY